MGSLHSHAQSMWRVAARGNGERSSCEKVLCDAASASVAVVCGGALAFCRWVNARVRVPAEAVATAGSRGGSRQVPDFRGAGGASVTASGFKSGGVSLRLRCAR